MRITSNTINFPDETLAEMWNSFDWNSAEEKILKWQKLLSIAAFKSKQDQVKKLSIKWKKPIPNWKTIQPQLIELFGSRYTKYLEI